MKKFKTVNYQVVIFSLVFLCLGFIIGFQISGLKYNQNQNDNNYQMQQPFGQNGERSQDDFDKEDNNDATTSDAF